MGCLQNLGSDPTPVQAARRDSEAAPVGLSGIAALVFISLKRRGAGNANDIPSPNQTRHDTTTTRTSLQAPKVVRSRRLFDLPVSHVW